MDASVPQRLIPCLLVLVVAAAPAAAATQDGTNGLDSATLTAFVDVTVVPMDLERQLPHQTVVVRGARIVALGPAEEIGVPADAHRIEGRGRWLMPGLTDANVHIWGPDELLLFVANGITTVRNLWGSPLHLLLRDRVATGELIGPDIVSSGPLMDGQPPLWDESLVIPDAGSAQAAVEQQAEAGYDFVEVSKRLGRPAYEALVAKAHALDLPVCGHVPEAVGLAGALAAGQDSIEHLDGFLEALRAAVGDEATPISDEAIAALAREVAATPTWNCPTLVAQTKSVAPGEARALLAAPEMRYVSPVMRLTWDPDRDFRDAHLTADDYAHLRAYEAMLQRIVRALHDAGAPLLLGTDASSFFVVPGFSIHEELALLVEAGLTPFEALVAGTRDAARFLGREQQAGTIAVGCRADLLLLSASPLADVAALKSRVGVMAAGRWYDEMDLQERLDALVAGYDEPVDDLRDLDPPPDLGGPIARYEVSFDDQPLAAERSSFSVDRRRVVTQVGYDPRGHLLVELDQRRGSGSDVQVTVRVRLADGEGRASFEVTQGRLTVKGSGRYKGVDVERPLPEKATLSMPALATEGRLWELLQPLGVGDTLSMARVSVKLGEKLELSDTVLNVRRLEDERFPTVLGGFSARCYLLSLQADDGSDPDESHLWIETATGLPLVFEQQTPLGLIRARRVQ